MVYVSAGELCACPGGPWRKWTHASRAIAKRCRLNAAMWREAEARDPLLAPWAAAFVSCTRGKGKWVTASAELRRMWLNELQGKQPLYTN